MTEDLADPARVFLTSLRKAMDGDLPAAFRWARWAVLVDPTCRWFSPEIAGREEVGQVARAVDRQIRMGVGLSRGGDRALEAIKDWRRAFASGLVREVGVLFQAERFQEALDQIRRIHAKGLDNAEIRSFEARSLSRMGRYADSARSLGVALHYEPQNNLFRNGLIRALAASGDVDRLVTVLAEEPAGKTAFLSEKISFYFLADIFKFLIEHHSIRRAVESARALFARPEPAALLRQAIQANAQSINWAIAELARHEATKALADAMARQDAVGWIDALSEISEREDASQEALDILVPVGPDTGHPIWHVANPFFQLWALAGTSSRVQQNWQHNAAISVGDSVEAILQAYQNWYPRHDQAKEFLLGLFDRLPERSVVVDLACGRGEWLRFMHTDCGVALENLFGLELHRSRVEGARALLLQAQDHSSNSRTVQELLRAHICVGDLLQMDAVELFKRYGGRIDLITLFAVTPVFDDVQLRQFLATIERLGAERLVVTTHPKTWDFNLGRPEEDRFFEEIGYRVESQDWTGEKIAAQPPLTLLAPRKYWVSRRFTVYRKARA